MSATYHLNKRCPVCNKLLADSNKTGYCNNHRDRTGANNPFYGKTFSEETLEKIKSGCAAASKKKWKDPEYRKKVIESVTGLKRSDEFKELQRQHALKQFDDLHQREIRSIKMKQMWKDGIIVYNENRPPAKSKQEQEFIKLLSLYIDPEDIKTDQLLHYTDETGKIRWLFPDIIYKSFIIEYNGNYWHADPNIYEDDFIIDGKTAKSIRERDLYKKQIYESLGYTVIYAWSNDFKENKEACVNAVVSALKIENNNIN